jgi:DNA-binding MarR family transcriptional regulator
MFDAERAIHSIEHRIVEIERVVGLNSAINPQKSANPVHSVDLLQLLSQVRRTRDAIFPKGYFADTAWELLLELEQARRSAGRLAISDLGVAAAIPPTTVLRYVDRLVADGFAERRPDPTDRRRIFVRLTEQGASAMNEVLVGTPLNDHQQTSPTQPDAQGFREFPGASVFA